MEISIALEGCDDTTYITLDVDEKEIEFLKKISKLSKEAHTYGCMPILSIGKFNERESFEELEEL
jgi:hypothetical protein